MTELNKDEKKLIGQNIKQLRKKKEERIASGRFSKSCRTESWDYFQI